MHDTFKTGPIRTYSFRFFDLKMVPKQAERMHFSYSYLTTSPETPYLLNSKTSPLRFRHQAVFWDELRDFLRDMDVPVLVLVILIFVGVVEVVMTSRHSEYYKKNTFQKIHIIINTTNQPYEKMRIIRLNKRAIGQHIQAEDDRYINS